MGSVFILSLAGGMLGIVSTGRMDQIAWRFLRLVGLIALALFVVVLAWRWKAGDSGSDVGWTTALMIVGAIASCAIVFLAPFSSGHSGVFRVIGLAGALAGLGAALLSSPAVTSSAGFSLRQVAFSGNRVLGGLLIGSITIAWLLGHAYLTATRMTISPLRHFSRMLSAAVFARILFVGLSLLAWWGGSEAFRLFDFGLIASLRIGAGLLGVGVFSYMVADCVKLRSTQSATGILYFGSIFAYVGELASQQLVMECGWPL